MTRSTITVVFTCCLVLLLQAVATASIAPPRQYCAALVKAPNPSSRVATLSPDSCSKLSSDEALRKLLERQALPGSVDTVTLLMTWYQDKNYLGNMTNIYGTYGTCDADGYRVAPNAYWSSHLSSIKGSGYCKYVDMTSTSGAYEGGCLPKPALHDNMDNEVAVIYVKYSMFC